MMSSGWELNKIIEPINPIVHLVTAFESNEPQIHKITTKFNNLEADLIEKLLSSRLQSAEGKEILPKFRARKKFGLAPIHLSANLLDPHQHKVVNWSLFRCLTQ